MDILRRWSVLKFIRIFAVLSVVTGSHPQFVYREDWQEQSCSRVISRVRHQAVRTTSPPHLDGDWVSYRCEIRSGPEYVIRHFRFQNNSFESVVYRYADPDCHQPLYAIHSYGAHRLLKASWTVRGGTEANYEVTTTHVIPYSKNASREVAAKLLSGCGDLLAPNVLKPYSRYLIYSAPPPKSKTSQDEGTSTPRAVADVDCFSALNFTLHDLQLVMVEARQHHHRHSYNQYRRSFGVGHEQQEKQQQPQQAKHHHHLHHHNHHLPLEDNEVSGANDASSPVVRRKNAWWGGHSEPMANRELLLGAVHSRPRDRQSHRPSSFQTALKDALTPGCGVCSRVLSSDPLNPPRLSTHAGTLLSLQGEWVSTRCESRQYGMFLTRWLHFLPDGSSWQGQYDYYHDSVCHNPSFSLNAKGSYAGGTDSKLVQGAKDYSFKVTRLKVTPHDQATVDSMNHYGGDGCGKAHAWKTGQVQDVTWTGGCVTLGIRLPNMERDIMKMEIVHRKLHLYVGQRLVDKKPGTGFQQERPTAFQEPLVKCDQVNLDMSINTAPGGNAWAGGVALPLSAGPEGLFPDSHNLGSVLATQGLLTLALYLLYKVLQ